MLLATTCYDKPDCGYVFSIARTREVLHEAGIETGYCLLQGNCHVDDARNDVVHTFLASDCTDLVFLDADVSWKPEDLLRLCQHDADVVGGVYPYRREKGDGMPVRLLEGDPQPSDGGLLEVEGLPTGFLRVRRHVLAGLAQESESYPSLTGDVAVIFERALENGTRWGGDLNFCRKWRARGGKVYADFELVLGHAGRYAAHDSLGAFFRRRNHSTLQHVVQKVRDGTETVEDMAEVMRAIDNPFGAAECLLSSAVALARRAEGPIIEAGSGLTTILMAAATEQTVFCLEHDEHYAERLRQMARLAGVSNIGLCVCDISPIIGNRSWYDLTGKTLPDSFALALLDGPPRGFGDRTLGLDLVEADTIICDDVDDMLYRGKVSAWAERHGKSIQFIEPRTAIIAPEALKAAEAA